MCLNFSIITLTIILPDVLKSDHDVAANYVAFSVFELFSGVHPSHNTYELRIYNQQ